MAYRVIKWVKGRPYLYEQRSFRMGGKVRTESIYLGPASGAEVKIHQQRKQTAAKVSRAVSEPAERVQAVEPEQRATSERKAAANAGVHTVDDGLDFSPPRSKRKRAAKTNNPKRSRVITTKASDTEGIPSFTSKIDFKAKGISELSMRREQGAFMRRLQRLGVHVSGFPEITVKYGKSVTHKKTRNGYVVTLRRHARGQRTQFKDAFSKAVIRAGLDLVREQKPDVYLPLSESFDESFSRTQSLLRSFIISSTDKNKMFKWIGLMMWGNIAQLKKNLSRDARRVGVIDFSQRRTGNDELINTLAAVNREGIEYVRSDQKKYHAQANRERERAQAAAESFSRWNPRRKEAIRQLLRAEARVEAQKEMWRKLVFIDSEFYTAGPEDMKYTKHDLEARE